ncbi:MAG: GntR family transcriptional regulator [Gracilibacter sp. BRH_c7a]|nr:MAG: GntR family transcriptional regulator [Gracilibacter sp. BRH_c7a]
MGDEAWIDKSSVIPIYYQLAKLLEGQIRRGEFQPGEVLPTEMEIAARFEISRMTVRRAIAELVSAGMISTQQGRGTFVARPKLDNIVFELNNFNEEIEQRGLQQKITLVQADIIRANKLLQEKFEIVDSNAKFLYFKTVLSAEDERIACENKYVFYTKSKPILEKELKDPSLPEIIAAHSDYVPIGAKKVLQVSITTEEEAVILGVPPNTPVIVIEQTIYAPDRKPIGWGRSVYRGDRYKLTSYDGWYKKE